MAFALTLCATGGLLAAWFKIVLPLGRLLQLAEDLSGATGSRPKGWAVLPATSIAVQDTPGNVAGHHIAFTDDLLALATATGPAGTLVVENPGVQERS